MICSLFRQGFDRDDGLQLYPQQPLRLSLPLDRSNKQDSQEADQDRLISPPTTRPRFFFVPEKRGNCQPMENTRETLSFIGQGAFVVAMLRKVLQRANSEKKDGNHSTGSSTRDYTF